MFNSVLVQLIGAVGYSLLAISYLRKNKKQILFMQIFAYIFFVIHYYLLNGSTGAICNLIGLVALIVIYLFEKYKLKNKSLIVMFFILLILVINIVAFQNIFSIFPMVASIIVILSFLVDDENIIRIIGIVAAICWLIYAIVYKSYSAMVFEVIILFNAFVSLVRDVNNKKIININK